MQPIEVRLTSRQRRRLEQIRDHAPSARVFERAVCLLRSAAGDSATRIAETIGLSRDAVSDIRERWRARGLRSLADRPRSGRPPKADAAYRRELRRTLDRSPLRYGYAFTNWSIARLDTHLRGRTGVRLSDDWLRRLAHAEGFVVGRPKHTLNDKRDPEAFRGARKRLDRRKRGR